MCIYRNDNYQYVNQLLREQLDAATAANQKLVTELSAVRQEYEEKQLDWNKEEQVFWLLITYN